MTLSASVPHMTPERKTKRVDARLPPSLVARVDYIARNNDGAISTRSAALVAALEAWLPIQEERLVQLGVIQKKAR